MLVCIYKHLFTLDTGFFCPCHDHRLVETGIYAIMIPTVRPAFIVPLMLFLASCQTASLEDAAPTSANFNVADAGATDTAAVAADAASEQTPDAGAAPEAPASPPTPITIRRNPGITSIIPIEKTAPVVNKDFVAAGADRSGTYPKIGVQPKAANAQFSDAEKAAADAEMAELLRTRASTPDARAEYEARLAELRALAATHASQTQQEIEN